MRCTSNSSSLLPRRALITWGPMLRFGTKRPSIISICKKSAWAILSTSRPKFEKSAASSEGATYIRFIIFLSPTDTPFPQTAGDDSQIH